METATTPGFHIEMFPPYEHPKFNFNRIRLTVKVSGKSSDNILKDLENMFQKTLDLVMNTDAFKSYSEVRIGTKLILNNYSAPLHIEFKNSAFISGPIIMNRLARLFQSGDTTEIKTIEIVYSLLGRNLNKK